MLWRSLKYVGEEISTLLTATTKIAELSEQAEARTSESFDQFSPAERVHYEVPQEFSRLCQKVFTVERIDGLVGRARKVFDRLHYHNIVSRIDDGTVGWPAEAPFDAILVTAGGPRIPEPLLAQLADPGRLVMPVGGQDVQDLQVVEKRDGVMTLQTIEQVRFVDLIGAHGWPN